MRRFVLLAAICTAGAASAIAPCCQAQPYPSKPIRFIVPFPPGGGTDTNSRALAQRISKNTGWVFVVDNKPGAGGNIGADAAAKSPPDGYTLVMGQTSNLAINPFLYARPPFDALKDLDPVALVSSVPLVIVASGKSPYRSMADVIAAAKAKPDSITFASPGNGTVGHLAGELIMRIAGVKLVHVPYKGAGPALTELLGGQIDFMIATMPGAVTHVRSGRMRAIGISTLKRSPELPEVPTIAESGVPGYEFVAWFGLLAPAGTPPARVEQLHTLLAQAVDRGDLRTRFAAEGVDPQVTTPKQFQSTLAAETVRWKKIIEAAGIKAAKGNKRIGDIGFAVERLGKANDFSVVEDLCGHGVGYKVHEDPYVPNYGDRGSGEKLKSGMVLAIEPMFTEGNKEVFLDTDGYTYKTVDGSRSAHFEHTIVITNGEPEILTKL